MEMLQKRGQTLQGGKEERRAAGSHTATLHLAGSWLGNAILSKQGRKKVLRCLQLRENDTARTGFRPAGAAAQALREGSVL